MLVVKRKLQNKTGNGEVPQQRNNRSAWTLAHGTSVPDIMLRL